MRKHRVNTSLRETLDLGRNHLRGKAAHRRRRRSKLEAKSRWLSPSMEY